MRLKVSHEKEINSSVENLWDLISLREHLNLVHPFCKINEAIEWNQKAHKDMLVYLNGLRYFREFKTWKEKKGYTLIIGTKRGKKSEVRWQINSENKKTFLKISVKPYLFVNLPSPLYKVMFYVIVKPMLTKYLKSVLGGIDWYMTHKKPVPKNYFGKHIWFSNY